MAGVAEAQVHVFDRHVDAGTSSAMARSIGWVRKSTEIGPCSSRT